MPVPKYSFMGPPPDDSRPGSRPPWFIRNLDETTVGCCIAANVIFLIGVIQAAGSSIWSTVSSPIHAANSHLAEALPLAERITSHPMALAQPDLVDALLGAYGLCFLTAFAQAVVIALWHRAYCRSLEYRLERYRNSEGVYLLDPVLHCYGRVGAVITLAGSIGLLVLPKPVDALFAHNLIAAVFLPLSFYTAVMMLLSLITRHRRLPG